MVALDLRSLVRQERARRQAVQLSCAACACREDAPGEEAAEQQEINLDEHRVGADAVKGLSYVPDFLSFGEEAAILRCIDAAPSGRWVASGERRILNFGGKPGCPSVTEALPPFLAALVQRLVAAGVYPPHRAPNHVLVNDYRFGAGIPAHADGPLYWPVVATITLAGPALIAFTRGPDAGRHPGGELVTEVLLRERCLLVVSGDAYTRCEHSIPTRTKDAIAATCCNARQAGAAAGDSIMRAERRVSLVFVHKRFRSAVEDSDM